MSNPIQTLGSKLLYQGKVFDLVEDEIRLPNGTIVNRAIVKHPGAVVIIPKLNNGRLVLVSQYRHAVGQTLYEFPAGTLEKGENPLACAKRELVEEVGYQAGQLVETGKLFPAPGFCSEVQHCFVATGLTPAQAPGDEDEIIAVKEFAVSDVEQLISDGQLVDAKSIAAFFQAKLRGLL